MRQLHFIALDFAQCCLALLIWTIKSHTIVSSTQAYCLRVQTI